MLSSSSDVQLTMTGSGGAAACRSPHIVRYIASVLPHGSTKLAIAMELMAASAADLVSSTVPCAADIKHLQTEP